MHPRSARVNRPVLERAVGETTHLHDDPSTESGAEELARRIRTYWTARGHAVTESIERLEGIDGRRPVFRITSNLTGGLPRRR